MDSRTAAAQLATGRIAFGSACLVAPRLVGRAWIGPAARQPAVSAVLRAFAVRDLAIGVEAMLAIRGGDVERRRRAFIAGAASDATDFLAALAVGRALPATARAGTLTMAAVAAALGAALAARPPA